MITTNFFPHPEFHNVISLSSLYKVIELNILSSVIFPFQNLFMSHFGCLWQQVAQATSKQMSRRDPLRPYMNTIDKMLQKMVLSALLCDIVWSMKRLQKNLTLLFFTTNL